MKPYHDATNLRLQIEIDTAPRSNLVLNPSGEKGAWFWDTPVANTAVTVVGNALQFTTTVAQAAYTETALMAIPADKYVGAMIDLTAITASHNVKVRLDWYNSAKTYISSSPHLELSAPATAQGFYLLAPAGAVYVKLRITLHNGTGNPSANASATFRRVKVAWSDSDSGDIFLGSVEPYTWRDILGPTFAIAVKRKALDVGTLEASINDATLDPAETSDVRPGRQVRLQALINSVWTSIYEGKITKAHVEYRRNKRPGATDRTIITLAAVDNIATLANRGESRGVATVAALPYLLEGKGVPWNVNGSGSQIFTAPAVVAVNADASTLDQVAITRDTALGYAWVDRNNVLNVYDAATLGATVAAEYADQPPNLLTNPSFEDGTVGWLTAGGSLVSDTTTPQHGTKVAKWTAPAAPVSGQAILSHHGSATYRFTVDRTKSYSAGVWVKRLDANSPDKVRLFAVQYDAAGVFVGSTLIQDLIPIPVGVWTFVGVENFRGFRSDAVTSSLVSVYPASAFNSGSGGGVVLFDAAYVIAAPVPPTNYATLPTPALAGAYSDVVADFDTERCINEVHIKWLRYDAATDETTEVDYGPYVDQPSIDVWGPFSATFTICGSTESASAIAAYAAQILAANATPERRANSIKVPVRDAASLAQATTIDLYSLVNVAYSDKVDEAYRVTSLEHTITPEKWIVDYSFDVDGSVAAPQATPAPPPVPVSQILPQRTAAGTVSVALSGANNGNTAITFPAGRFDVPPIVIATLQNAPGGSAKFVARAVGVTATGASIYCYTGDSTTTTSTVVVGWFAVQMAEGSAAG